MRQSKAALALVAVLIGAVSLPALSRGGAGGHGGGRGGAATPGHSRGAGSGGHAPRRVFAGPRIGFFLGAPLYAPLYYAPAPIYYSPPPAPLYMEKAPALPEALDWQYWYYCPGSDTYFPYVKECPGGWQQVTPQPPPPAKDYPGY